MDLDPYSPRRIVWAGSAAAVRSSNLYVYSIVVLHGSCLQSVLSKSALLLADCHASAFCFLCLDVLGVASALCL